MAQIPVRPIWPDKSETSSPSVPVVFTQNLDVVTSEDDSRTHQPLVQEPNRSPDPEVVEMLEAVQQYLEHHDLIDPEVDKIGRQIRYGSAMRIALGALYVSERERGRWRSLLSVLQFFYEHARHRRHLEAAHPPIWVLGTEKQRDEWWRKWGEAIDAQAAAEEPPSRSPRDGCPQCGGLSYAQPTAHTLRCLSCRHEYDAASGAGVAGGVAALTAALAEASRS